MPEENSGPITAEMLIFAAIMNTPIPIRHLYGLYGGRSTFASWKKQGLDIRKLDGLGPSVVPSQFIEFMQRKWGSYAPRIQKSRRPAANRCEQDEAGMKTAKAGADSA